ncbi:TRAP transporter substrate-binding protein [Vibrio furnissii]|uniref:TRAP transporter substrate-binding protein n=1 Tax=Vibrio furnissii TaxID=29494 RepID=UPI001E366BC8|nr:TRAP transporter substrate-binding protein [Vibrio furnissii]MCG6234019.1 TRAP transporter substrate-binding protein [Vibrio furnissii]MCG6260223.1 TRAP transporter substrate-binding protein [Vibrio furnissii]UHJ62989.1 TRAP transporter substrate-binding protein [Vibrio furnissii]WJG24361.1 TRAP transporter substrate-binding protein [Vibrio furnissii]
MSKPHSALKWLLASAIMVPFSQSAYATTILRLAYAENSQPVKEALHYIGKAVEEKTNGSVIVQFFPDGQLGGERELVEMTQVGAIDLTKVSSGLLESFSPLYGVFSLPYLFESEERFYQVMDNPDIMGQVYRSTESQGFAGVGWYDSGARSFYMTRGPINTVADLRGKKIRVMQSETSIETMKLLGASPIAMGQAEVYTSLQQGIIDGAENNEFALTIARHGEVAKFYSYDMHTRIPDIVIMSTLTKRKLTPDQLVALKEAITESVEVEKQAWKVEMEKTRELAQTQFGVQFNTVELAPFKAAVQPIYDKLKSKPQIYALYQQINQLTNE